MKITFIIQDLFQQGAQYVTAMMIRGFVAKGYDVDLIVSKVHSDLLAAGNIKPFEIPQKTNIIILKDRKASKNISEIRNYLKVSDTQAVISMGTNYTHALAIASIGLLNRPKIAYVEHSGIIGLDRSTGNELPRPSWASLEYLRSKFITSRFDTIMAVSKGTARGVERMNRLNDNSVKIVYNPVIDDLYYQKLSMNPSHKWLINKSIPTFVAAGAHSIIKNHIMLFEAIKMVNQRTPVRLVLFGKGNLTEEYKQWIDYNQMSDNISIAEHSAQLPAEIKASDGLIISSNMESFSLVLVEAMAANVPIISTNCPYGPPELLQNGTFGKLVPLGDPNALSQAIIEQIINPLAPAPKKAWEKFTLDNVVKVYEQALNL